MTASEWSAELVSYRLERANEALEEARLLADAGRWNGCVNRLYYACFYAVTALLIGRGLSSPKHTGVRSLFNQNFVKTGQVPKAMAQVYNDLFERRQQSDYTDFKRFEESQVHPWMLNAEKFVKYIESMLGDQPSEDPTLS